ncbi:MAG: MBL fold metallo-hydrolase [Promethearchaeota archaeon]
MLSFEQLTERVVLVRSDARVPWKCQGLVVNGGGDGGAVLVDCNYTPGELRSLLDGLGCHVEAYFSSHFHLDHVNNAKHLEELGIPYLCPAPERDYYVDLDRFLEDNGAVEWGAGEQFEVYIREHLGFAELSGVTPFRPGDSFNYGPVTLETIPAPGHSPGHTAFAVFDGDDSGKGVLFASDIGIERLGAWYGFKYCDISQIRESVGMLQGRYLGGEYVLASGHGPVFREKNDEVLPEILKKLDATGQRVLGAFSDGEAHSPRDLVFRGLYYPVKAVNRAGEPLRTLYEFWEYFTIKHQLEDLEARGALTRVAGDRWKSAGHVGE